MRQKRVQKEGVERVRPKEGAEGTVWITLTTRLNFIKLQDRKSGDIEGRRLQRRGLIKMLLEPFMCLNVPQYFG